MYLPSIFLKGNQCRWLADRVYLLLQNENANIYGKNLSWWKCFLSEVGQCLQYLMLAWWRVLHGSAFSEWQLLFHPQCFPRLFGSRFPPLPSTFSYAVMSYLCLIMHRWFWRCWGYLSPPPGCGIYTCRELGCLPVLHISPGEKDYTLSAHIITFLQGHEAVKSVWCNPIDSVPRVHPSFINFSHSFMMAT